VGAILPHCSNAFLTVNRSFIDLCRYSVSVRLRIILPVSSESAAMESFESFVVARALHVLGVVLWIGGVAFVTLVLLPALRRLDKPGERLALFELLEGRFALQARITTLITGVSGFYMLHFLHAWERYQQPQFWWIHLMTLVWLLFTLVLFVFEPLFLHRWFHELAARDDARAFKLVMRMHTILLTLSLVAVVGGVAGAHGGLAF
jgi:uncharacterized membrane protein